MKTNLKDYLPTSLFGRTFLIVVVPVLILQIAVSIVFLDRHWSEMTQRLAYAVTGEIMAVANQIEADSNNEARMQVIAEEALQSLSLRIHYDAGERMTLDSDNTDLSWSLVLFPFHTMERDLIRELQDKSPYAFSVVTMPEQKQVNVQMQLTSGVLMVAIPEGRLFSSSSYIFLLWMVGLSLLLFTVSMIFMRNQIRPIYRLGIIAERLGRGIPVERIKPSGAREVRQAAEAFIQMQDRINQYISQRTTMLAGVSHDLKTPLTRMRLQLEMMGDSADKEAMRADIHDMERMIEGYLSFAKGDGGEDMQRLPLTSFLEKAAEDAKRLGLQVTYHDVDEQDNIVIWAKPMALARVFDNIIHNASRHAKCLSVSLSVSVDHVDVIFEDNGPGIDDDKRAEMLKPFVRGEDSRNQKTGGVGLGLTIANDIMMAHGGALALSSSREFGGLKVNLSFPY